MDDKKVKAIKWLDENTDGKIVYKNKNVSLVKTNKYAYPELDEEQKRLDALNKEIKKKQQISVLDGTAKITEVQTSIRLSDAKDK